MLSNRIIDPHSENHTLVTALADGSAEQGLPCPLFGSETRGFSTWARHG